MMTHLEFVDRRGVSGVVDTELLVEYDGQYGEVETYVNRLRNEYQTVDGPADPEDAFEEILIDLPRKLPVREVRLREDEPS